MEVSHASDCRYADTPVFTGHTKEPRQQKLAQGKARRDAEKALLKLAARAQPKAEEEALGKAAGECTNNPFLAPPEQQAP